MFFKFRIILLHVSIFLYIPENSLRTTILCDDSSDLNSLNFSSSSSILKSSKFISMEWQKLAFLTYILISQNRNLVWEEMEELYNLFLIMDNIILRHMRVFIILITRNNSILINLQNVFQPFDIFHHEVHIQLIDHFFYSLDSKLEALQFYIFVLLLPFLLLMQGLIL